VIFKNNSEYIIPFVIKDYNIFKIGYTISYVDTGILYNYLYVDILLKNETVLKTIHSIIKNEPNFNFIKISQNKIQLRFLIDKSLDFIVLPIINNGYDALSKDDLRDCVFFWKEKSLEVLSKQKTPTARESSRGLFFLFIHNLIFVILSFIFRTIPLFI